MKKISLTINRLPPSVNQLYQRNQTGGVFLRPRAKDFKEELGWLAKTKIKKPLNGNVKLDIVFKFRDKRKHDIDNLLKVLLDSLEGIVFIDDNQVTKIEITKMRGLKEKTIINIEKNNFFNDWT